MSQGPYWITGPWAGRLAILPRPRGSDWLGTDAWARHGLQTVVSLLTPDESADLDLQLEAGSCTAHSIEFHSFPIVDRSVPSHREETLRLVRTLDAHLAAGKNVGIHCRQALGRSALIAACLLVASGLTPEAAFDRLARARGQQLPETSEQREWVTTFAPLLATSV
jgi:protein-tyrosine phosphatase